MGQINMKQSTQYTNFLMSPPRSCIYGDAIDFGAGTTWVPTHNSKTLISCIGAQLLIGGTTGVLAVHLVDDPDGVWFLMDLQKPSTTLPVQVQQYEFDLVGKSDHGTTVTLDTNLVLFPGLYKDGSSV
jgi:hypothetical protein